MNLRLKKQQQKQKKNEKKEIVIVRLRPSQNVKLGTFCVVVVRLRQRNVQEIRRLEN